MEELSTSVPRDRSGSVAFSSCRISLVTLVLAAAAAALITLLFWYMLVWPRSWTCACLLRLSWSVPRVAYNEVVSCDAGHNLWKLLTGSVWFGQHSYPCMSRLSESQACRLSYVHALLCSFFATEEHANVYPLLAGPLTAMYVPGQSMSVTMTGKLDDDPPFTWGGNGIMHDQLPTPYSLQLDVSRLHLSIIKDHHDLAWNPLPPCMEQKRTLLKEGKRNY